MTYRRLSDDHMQQVRAAAEHRFSRNEVETSDLSRSEIYVKAFTDGYLKCFSIYDCGHKRSEASMNNLTGNPENPKKQPHSLNDNYLGFVVSTAKENAKRATIDQCTPKVCYVIGFLEGYTTCWNIYQLHDLEDQMGEIVDPTPEEVELIQKLISGWNLGKASENLNV
jgi:hypothetical protein